MSPKPIPYGKQKITDADIEAVIKTLKSDYLTQGPTIAGEAGAEAIIPLKNGSVPLKVDLTQLVQVMAEQTKLTKLTMVKLVSPALQQVLLLLQPFHTEVK